MQVRLTGELDEITGECDRFSTNAAILEKRGRNFDKVLITLHYIQSNEISRLDSS